MWVVNKGFLTGECPPRAHPLGVIFSRLLWLAVTVVDGAVGHCRFRELDEIQVLESLGILQVHPIQGCSLQVGSTQVCPTQVSFIQARIMQISISQVGFLQIGFI